jgi:hypothetical protein
MTSENPQRSSVDRETVLVLVRVGQIPGGVAHLPDTSGFPRCNARVKLSLWQIEERPMTASTICKNCLAVKPS